MRHLTTIQEKDGSYNAPIPVRDSSDNTETQRNDIGVRKPCQRGLHDVRVTEQATLRRVLSICDLLFSYVTTYVLKGDEE